MAAVQCKQDRQRQYRTLLFEYIASSREGARRQNWCGIPCFFDYPAQDSGFAVRWAQVVAEAPTLNDAMYEPPLPAILM